MLTLTVHDARRRWRPSRLCRLAALFLALLALSTMPAAAQTETIEYYGLDALGSVRVVFDQTGALIGRVDFMPFGGDVSDGSSQPKERFAGLLRDGEAGLDYAQARMYQSRIGRFSTADPLYEGLFVPQRWNRYSYALNSPTTTVDKTGLTAESCAEGTVETWEGGWDEGTQSFNSWLNCKQITKPGSANGGAVSATLFFLWLKNRTLNIFSSSDDQDDIGGAAGGGGSGIDPLTDLLDGQVQVAQTPATVPAALAVAATAAASRVVGNGPVNGTRIHTLFRTIVDSLKLPGVHTEVSYVAQKVTDWGKPGSVRLDVVQYGPNGQILTIFDLKTGAATLSNTRTLQILNQLPLQPVPPNIVVIRP